MQKWVKKTGKVAAWTLGTFAAILVLAQIILSPSVATRLVNKYAPRILESDISFGRVSVSIFRSFPNVSLKIEDAALTYPHDWFSDFEKDDLTEGRSPEVDTLASFRTLRAAVNVPALIIGEINIHSVELSHPRIFAKQYSDKAANWKIFDSFEDSPESEEDSSPLRLKLHRLSLSENAHIVFTDAKDTLAAQLELESFSAKGKIDLETLQQTQGNVALKGLDADLITKDKSFCFVLSTLSLKGDKSKFDLDAEAVLKAVVRSAGEISIPLSLSAKAGLPDGDKMALNLESLEASIAGTPLKAYGTATLEEDKYSVDLSAGMNPIPLGDLVKEYGSFFYKKASDIDSDARLYVNATAKGDYIPSTGELPALKASISVPSSYIRNKKASQRLGVKLRLDAQGGAGKTVDVTLDTLKLSASGLSLNAQASVVDLLGDDPMCSLDAALEGDMNKAMGLFPKDFPMKLEGNVDAALEADFLLSDLNANNIGKASITGLLHSDDFDFVAKSDTLSACLRGLDIELGTGKNKSDEGMYKGERTLNIKASLDTLDAQYETMFARAGKIELAAHNSADILSDSDLKHAKVHPFAGYISARSLAARDVDSSFVAVRNTRNSFTLRPKNGNRNIPLLHLKSDNGFIGLRRGLTRVLARDLGIDISAGMNTFEKKQRLSSLRDSLARVYPNIPKDSLLRHAMEQRRKEFEAKPLPEWLSEEDFKKNDLNLALSGALAKYFNEWDLSGKLNLGSGRLMTPSFPLRNSLEDVSATLTNDKISLKNFLLRSGSSDLKLSGSLSNLKQVLRGRGILNLDLRVKSDGLNVNELFAAMDAGAKYDKSQLQGASSLSDAEYEQLVTSTELPDTLAPNSLIVVPGNVNASIFLDAQNIQYSTLTLDWMQGEIACKERCVQVRNMIAASNMGNLSCEAFYSTKTKKNIKAGITLDLTDITAEKAIELVPAIDSLAPMLRSFSGLLSLNLAATTSLDEQMNILFPTVKGVISISGNDLFIQDLGDLSKIARLLMFKNKKQVFVDRMEVNGLIEDGHVEVFPFILEIDRYKLALSGTQNLDMSFKYHISVMKWPLLFKFGIDLGGNFGKVNFHIGKAKYKREKKIPTFTKVIDQSNANLKEIIHNVFRSGIDDAVDRFDAGALAKEYKDSLHYVPAVDEPLDTLDSKSLRFLEKGEQIREIVDLENDDLDALDSLQIVRLDSLGIKPKELKKLQKLAQED